MTKQEAIDLARGKDLDTPTFEVLVFHISNPDYKYEFIRQEGSEVLVVDNNNNRVPSGKAELKTFPASELVNVQVYLDILLKSHESLLPSKPSNDRDLWKRIESLSGGDKSPFETPIGPTEECFSSSKMVSFIKGGETDPDTLHHLENCEACRESLDRFKKVYP